MSTWQSIQFFWPEIILLIGGCVVLFSDFVFKNKKMIGWFALLIVIISAFFIHKPTTPIFAFSGHVLLDGFTHVFRWITIIIIAASIVLSLSYQKLSPKYLGEYFALFLWMGAAMMFMASSKTLLMVFLSIEFVSLISYLLVGFLKTDAKSKEASLKYLLFGSFCSGLMLYGMSLLYGFSGTLDLWIIQKSLVLPGSPLIVIVSILFIFAGIGFKISMAPFRMWAPDVYEGAPTPVTAFLTVGPKALGFAVLIRLCTTVFVDFFGSWTHIIILLSIVTMTLGNVIALAQTNIKRLMAYSSIAQAGYLLMGIAVFNRVGIEGIIVYLIAYTLTNLGIFAIIIYIEANTKRDDIGSYQGLAQTSPFLAASLTIFLLSLAGIPPLAGFIGKFFVFAAAIQANYIMLAIAAIINSAIAVFYYLKIVKAMYFCHSTTSTANISLSLKVMIYILLVATVGLGIFPQFVIRFIS